MHAYYMLSMITKHDDLLGTLIHDVAHLLRLDIDMRLEAHNLTRVKWLALGVIHRNPPLAQAELAAKLELGAATVGRLVDRLVERGFVLRKKDPEDRRTNRLYLTSSAIELLEELDGTVLELQNDTLHSLSAKEVRGLNSGLLKLKENLKARALAISAVIFLYAHKLSSTANIATEIATTI